MHQSNQFFVGCVGNAPIALAECDHILNSVQLDCGQDGTSATHHYGGFFPDGCVGDVSYPYLASLQGFEKAPYRSVNEYQSVLWYPKGSKISSLKCGRQRQNR